MRKTTFRVGMPIVAGRKACNDWPDRPPFLFLGFWHHMYRGIPQPVAERIAAIAVGMAASPGDGGDSVRKHAGP